MRVEQRPVFATPAQVQPAEGGLRELTDLEAQAVAGGGQLLSERVEQQGPVSNGMWLCE